MYEKVKELFNKASLVYAGDFDSSKSELSDLLFGSALNEVYHWIRGKLLEELQENGEDAVNAKLYLPMHDIVVTVRVYQSYEDIVPQYQPIEPVSLPVDRLIGDSGERFYVVYGKVDTYLHNAIMAEEGNPVELLYKYLNNQLTELHRLAEIAGCDQQMLTERLLREHNIWDLQNIHRYGYIIRTFQTMLKAARSER